jgi:hypothetical protein
LSDHRLVSQSFDDYAKSDGVSATMLDYIRVSPAHLYSYMHGEQARETQAFSLGKAAHLAVFQPDLLNEDNFHIQPDHLWMDNGRVQKMASALPMLDEAGREIHQDGKVKVHWSGQFSEAKEWHKEHNTKEVITAAEFSVAMRIRDNAYRQPIVRALLSTGFAEQSLYVEDSHGTLRKSRFDYISTSGNAIPDLKTCRSASLDSFEKSILNYSYHMRAAYYVDNAKLAGLEKDSFVFICIETQPPYLVACYKLDDYVLRAGRVFYQRDIQLYRNCVESGHWPGYHDGVMEIGLPEYAMRKLEAIV